MKYIDKKKNDPRWKDLHTHRKWTSSAAILSWGWSRVVSSIRRCPRCPSTTCCSSSCREKVDACPNGDSKRHRTDQHRSQPRAFHLRRGRSCPTRSAGDLVILFAPMTTHSNCSTCRVVLRQIDLPVWREIKMVEDLFIDRRSMAPRWIRTGLVSRRRTDGEDRNRTYKSALGSCPYL